MITEALTVIGIPVVRGIAGWAQKAFEDGKISEFEIKRLFATVLRLGVPAAALYYGFSLSPEFAASLPIVADYVYSYIKKLNIKKK